jgi:hypothetical protein
MRPGNNARRPRGRPNRKQHGPPRAHTFDSHGPDVRIRGNAPQIYDKYVTLARDATASGDRIAAEGYYQFAEHYFRIMNDSTDPRRPAQQPPRSDQQQPVSEPAPPPPEQEQPQVEWPQQVDGAAGKAAGATEEPGESANAPPVAAEEDMPRRQPKGRPRGRRRAANGAKDPDAKPAAKGDGKSDGKAGAADGDGEEPNPAEEPGEGKSVTPSN